MTNLVLSKQKIRSERAADIVLLGASIAVYCIVIWMFCGATLRHKIETESRTARKRYKRSYHNRHDTERSGELKDIASSKLERGKEKDFYMVFRDLTKQLAESLKKFEENLSEKSGDVRSKGMKAACVRMDRVRTQT